MFSYIFSQYATLVIDMYDENLHYPTCASAIWDQARLGEICATGHHRALAAQLYKGVPEANIRTQGGQGGWVPDRPGKFLDPGTFATLEVRRALACIFRGFYQHRGAIRAEMAR